MNIPPIRILSQSLDLLGEVDTYTSLMFKRSWQGVGEFQAVVPLSAKDATKLAEGQLIMLGPDGHRVGIIQGKNPVEESKDAMITISGVTLNGLAAQRITLPAADPYNGGYDNVPPLTAASTTPSPVPAETILKTYADRHMVNPNDPTRKIPGLVLASDLGRGSTTVWMSRLEQLDSVLQKVGEYTDMGWEIYADLKNKRLVFDCVPGADRSYSQSSNSRVAFSVEFDNIDKLSYNHSVASLRNLGYAGGSGEGAERVILKVTNDVAEPTGFDRREIFLDCGTTEISETNVSMSLSEEGKHKLLDTPLEESLTATAAQSGSFIYRKHYDLGDKVTAISRRIGVMIDTRITSITERYEAQQWGIDIGFGAAAPNLGRVIRGTRIIAR